MHERKAQMEAIYTHMWASHEGGPFAPLDEGLHPRPHTILYEVAAACGVSASSRVLDVGSGRGNHSCALAQRFGCTVGGLDLAEFEALRLERDTRRRHFMTVSPTATDALDAPGPDTAAVSSTAREALNAEPRLEIETAPAASFNDADALAVALGLIPTAEPYPASA